MNAVRMRREPGTPPFLIAHRGLSSRAPENTLAAFERAIVAGADMLELDVHLTADERIAVIHDRTLQRTTTGNGAVRSYTSRETSRFDAGSWFDPRFASERVPMLEDVLDLVRGRGQVNVELKSHFFHREEPGLLERLVVDVIRRSQMLDYTILTSFDQRIVRTLRSIEPTVTTGILYHGQRDLFRRPSEIARYCGASVFICSGSQLSEAMLRDIRASGLTIAVYTVNEPSEALRLSALGIDAIISDAADLIRNTIPAR
jgi:glycerophosphoryl diester phosphodiesterase